MFIEVTERDTNSPISIGIQYIMSFAPGAGGGTNMELMGCNDWFAVDQDYMTVKRLIAAASLRHHLSANSPPWQSPDTKCCDDRLNPSVPVDRFYKRSSSPQDQDQAGRQLSLV